MQAGRRLSRMLGLWRRQRQRRKLLTSAAWRRFRQAGPAYRGFRGSGCGGHGPVDGSGVTAVARHRHPSRDTVAPRLLVAAQRTQQVRADRTLCPVHGDRPRDRSSLPAGLAVGRKGERRFGRRGLRPRSRSTRWIAMKARQALARKQGRAASGLSAPSNRTAVVRQKAARSSRKAGYECCCACRAVVRSGARRVSVFMGLIMLNSPIRKTRRHAVSARHRPVAETGAPMAVQLKITARLTSPAGSENTHPGNQFGYRAFTIRNTPFDASIESCLAVDFAQ